MTRAVLDSSALLAYLHEEPGADRVEMALDEVPVIGTANLAEVLTRLAESGEVDAHERLVRQGLLGQSLLVEPLTQQDAVTIAELRAGTRAAGLSLGDRACLALARRLGLPALTADRSWAGLDVGVDVTLIR